MSKKLTKIVAEARASEFRANQHLSSSKGRAPGHYLMRQGTPLHKEPHATAQAALSAYHKLPNQAGVKIHQIKEDLSEEIFEAANLAPNGVPKGSNPLSKNWSSRVQRDANKGEPPQPKKPVPMKEETIVEGSDLRCPSCHDNLGKDAENPVKAFCGTCGHSFTNKHGYNAPVKKYKNSGSVWDKNPFGDPKPKKPVPVKEGNFEDFEVKVELDRNVIDEVQSIYARIAAENRARKKAAHEADGAHEKLRKIHARAEKKNHTAELHSKIAMHIQHEVSNSVPDSDPYETIHRHVRKMGVPEYEVHKHIDAAVRKHIGHRNYNDYLDHMVAHATSHMHEETINENYRIAATHGMGADAKSELHNPFHIDRGTDYYMPGTGDKSHGKYTHIGKDHYRIKDDYTKKVHKFKYYDHNEYKKLVGEENDYFKDRKRKEDAIAGAHKKDGTKVVYKPTKSNSYWTMRKKQKANEEFSMSVGNGDPAKVTNATDNYSAQKGKKSVKTLLARRKKP